MLSALCFCLLLAAAHGQVQQLDENYLPPGGGGGNNVNRDCPPVNTITSYSDRLVVKTQTQIVSRPVVQFVKKTIVSRRVVPSVIVRSSVVRSTVVVPQEVVRTSNVVRLVTRKVTVPGGVREVVRTTEEVVRSTVRRQVTTTVETTQLRTSVQFRTQTQTITVSRTQFVPQISVYTDRQTVPGPNVVRTKVEEVLRTRVITQPAQQVVSTAVQQQVRFQTVRVTVPGAVITSTVVQQSQQVIPVQSEVVVPQVKTVRVKSTRQFERTLSQTFTTRQVVPVQVTSTSYVNSRIVQTQKVQVTSTDVRFNTNFVTITEPARDIVSVVHKTNIVFITQPGKVIPVVRSQIVEQIINREVISTKVVPNVVMRTEFVDLPCKSHSSGGGVGSHSGGFAAPLGGGSGRGFGPSPSPGGGGRSGSGYGRYGSYGSPRY